MIHRSNAHPRGVSEQQLVERIVASTGLTPSEAERVVQDVMAFYREPVSDYVRRRHGELHRHGIRNAEAFRRISHELSQRLVAPPDLSERQLRRIVYG